MLAQDTHPEPGTAPSQARENPPSDPQGTDAPPPPARDVSSDSLPTIPVTGDVATAPPVAASKPHEQIAEIIVTATKREQALRDIPASITALSGEDLEKSNAQGIEDIARLVPGLSTTTPGDSGTRVTIRGIAAPAATNSTTGVLFGDVSFNDFYLPLVVLDPNPFDIKSVEILKGPQGTLFGAGALNGAVRYVPEPPKMDEWEARYFLQYTRVDHGDTAPIYGAVVNAPILDDDRAAVRIMGFKRHSPGYIDNGQLGRDVNRVDQKGIRAIAAWNPDENLETTLTYAYQATDNADTSVADNDAGELNTDNRPRHSPQKNDYRLADLAIKWHLNWADLVSDSAYVGKHSDSFFDASSRLPGNGQTPLQLAQISAGHSDTYSQELRLVSPPNPDSPWRWLGGAFGWRQKIDVETAIPLSAALPGGLNDLPPVLGGLLDSILPGASGIIDEQGQINLAGGASNVRIEELALFGEVTRELGENWELTMGGRLFQTRSGGTKLSDGALTAAASQQLQSSYTADIKQQGFNPKLSLLWHPNKIVTTYAAVSKGFRVGGLQPGAKVLPGGQQPPKAFKSDSIWNYETGVRTNWFGGAMHFDVTAYYLDWKNPQVFQNGADGLTIYVDNAGGVASKGIEAALQTLLPYGFLFNFAGSWSRTVTTSPFTASDGSDVASGRRWPFAPNQQYAMTLGHMASIGNWSLDTSLTYTYLAKATTDLSEKLSQNIFDFAQADLQIGLENPALRWLPDIGFVVNNLADKRGVTNRFVGNLEGTVPLYEDVTYIRPRTYTLRLSGSF
ncbi:TonB-dependent receptor [Solimonas terrae]|uniref:TonB-dependent receptor n=1 Tax=Solimonas terrae TaxID=1396819 RepID=A0A6M2BUI7_9GAMM|nr:TonB-dependent receptor [Solimonas terrae]NGY05587.1 TonB-dependent receptor [Solimonas terrae]